VYAVFTIDEAIEETVTERAGYRTPHPSIDTHSQIRRQLSGVQGAVDHGDELNAKSYSLVCGGGGDAHS
jgi:hypothetical protein